MEYRIFDRPERNLALDIEGAIFPKIIERKKERKKRKETNLNRESRRRVPFSFGWPRGRRIAVQGYREETKQGEEEEGEECEEGAVRITVNGAAE